MASARVVWLGLALLGGACFQTVQAQTKRALIIAIGAYPRPELTGYRVLHSANDIPLIQGALERHGFRASDIRVLKNDQAKREAILSSLSALADQSEPGDYVVIHYSGHGHRLTDDSGDESDGYDEVLVPWGASANLGPEYDGSGHIRDDLFGTAISAIGNRVIEDGARGQVLVLVDACFSGSITRSTLPVRGSADPIGPPGMKHMLDRKRAEMRDALMDGGDPMPKSVVLITATRFGELDHEVEAADGQTVGPLSLAFSHAMADLEVGASYQLLYELIRAEMGRIARYQHPSVEGNLMAAVMGGDISDPVVYQRVLRSDGDSMVVIDGGVLSGVGLGSGIRFARPSASGFTETAHGRVVRTGHLESDVVVFGASPDSLVGALSYVTERAPGFAEDSVFLADSGDDFAAALERALSDIGGGSRVGLAKADGDAAFRLETAGDANMGLFRAARTPDGPPIRYFSDDEAGGIQAAGFLKALVLGKFLGGVELSDPGLDVVLEFRPAKLRIIEQWPEPPICRPSEADIQSHTATKSGVFSWTVDPDQGYLLGVNNQSDEGVYVNLLLLAADGGIEPLYPNQNVRDNYLPPGTDFLIPQCFLAIGRDGVAEVKLFATRSPLNLADVLAGIEAGTRTQRSGAGAFEAAIRNAAGTRTRSGDDPPGAGVTRSILLLSRNF